MEFIQYSVAWAKGEIFEASLIGSTGLLTVLLALVCHFAEQTPQVKAMFWPLLSVGFIFLLAGISGYFSNQNRIQLFEQAWQLDPLNFVTVEKARVEEFAGLYTFTLILSSTCFTGAITLFYLSNLPHLRAIGLALALVGLAGLVIDAFAKERADQYYKLITIELSQLNAKNPPQNDH